MKQKSGKALSLLLVLCMLVSMFTGLSITASAAAAADTVTVQLVGKDGAAKSLATWTFDSENQTYKDNATGSELAIVKDYSSAPLVYTGLNKKLDPRCLSVTTKGIPLEDLYTYASTLAGGIDLRGDTAMYIADNTGYKDEFTYDQYWGLKRYNYMSWYNAGTYAAASADNCNDGVEVPSTLAIVGYHSALFGASQTTADELAKKADSANSLRISIGMQQNGNKTIADSWVHTGNNSGSGDINEGNLSVKNINVIKFTPRYIEFNVKDGVVSGTEGQTGFSWKAGNATVTTADNWAKAAKDEKVTLTVTPDDGCQVTKVSVKQGSKDITVASGDNNVYTFTMPAAVDGESVSVEIETTGGSASTKYAVTAASVDNGTVTVSAAEAAEGDTVTVTAVPATGYQLKEGSLKYNQTAITAAGAEANTWQFTMPGEAVTVTAEFEAVTPDWNGSTIASADDFVAFAAAVNAGDSFSGKTVTLAGDVDLSAIADWTPVGDATHPFAGTFDGAGHTVSGLTITDVTGGYHGLFGYITGTVKDFTVAGTIGTAAKKITSGADNVGGAVGYNDGTVSGVTGNVTVYINGGIYAVGGVVGQNGQTGVIKNCANTASVMGMKHTGGVCGRSYGKIDSCYNTGNITGTGGGNDGIGGIVGVAGNKNSTYKNSVTNCYNTGTVSNSGGRWHGGIVGMADSAATVTNCYNIGTIAAGYSWNWNPIIGHVDRAYTTVSNNYSLQGLKAGDTDSATKPLTIGTIKTADEMKADTFIAELCGDGRAFVKDSTSINNGYPILRWQASEDSATVTNLTIESDPTKLTYVKGEKFDTTGIRIKATWSDGTSEYISDCTANKTDALTESCKVTVSASYEGKTVSKDYDVTVITVTGIEITTPPTNTEYVAGQTFSKLGMVVTVKYSNNTTANVTDYTFAPNTALTVNDKTVTITWTAPDSTNYNATQAISVAPRTLDKISVTTKPTNLFYAADETFDPTGMVVKAYYTDKPTTGIAISGKTEAQNGYTWTLGADNKTVTVSYTEDGVTKTASFELTRTASNAPKLVDGAYQLGSADDLAWFANKVNVKKENSINGILTADITISSGWTSIGAKLNVPFAGTIDGNAHKITFALEKEMSAGFISYFSGTVKNLTIDGNVKFSTGENGVIVSCTKGAATIENCVNKADVTVTATSVKGSIGGILGKVGSDNGTTIRNCVNEGNISGSIQYVGGIVGKAYGKKVTITGCANTGSVSSTDNQGYGLGGIVGTNDGGAAITGCYNTGSVSGRNAVGGIVGMTPGATISDCYNTGAVTMDTDPANSGRAAGGVIGYLMSGNSTGTLTVSNCYNTGAVTSTTEGLDAYVGALIGNLKASDGKVSNCYYLGSGTAINVPSGITVTQEKVESRTEAELKAAEIITLLNGENGTAFAADSAVNALNGGYPVLNWQLKGVAMAVTFNVTPSTAKIVVKAADDSTVQPIEENGKVYALVLNEEYTYYITATGYTGVSDKITPAGNVTVTVTLTEAGGTGGNPGGTGNVNAAVWDGKSIDVSWYTPDADEYYISTPAQLAGLAAIVNGIYNSEIDTFAGNTSYIVDNRGYSSGSGPNGMNKSTPDYHYGSDNFAGKTVYITDDINMGSANYMPIGGQYLMTKDDTTTKIDASFCGVFDGGGHKITINCDRHCTGNYGDGQSVGLIGRLGVHDNDDVSLRPTNPAVRNVAVYGSVKANRSVGGIVGKLGKTTYNNTAPSGTGSLVENCANFATITATDSKGTGGIVGAAWNGGEIRNCYNAGSVTNTGKSAVGGIAGSNEVKITNCYNIGKITGPTGSTTASIATSNGRDTYENCYWLTGTADVGVYNKTLESVTEKSAAELKSTEMVSLLGTAFTTDSGSVNNGYPILKWQKTGGSSDSSGSSGNAKDGESTETKLPFVDVTGHWALDAISYVYENKLFEGVSETKFAPNTAMTRGMFVTVLYRLAGEPEVTEAAEFTDVDDGDWYARAVAWAAKNGIVEGYGDTFGPNDLVTREQMAVILMRYSAWKKYDTTAGGTEIKKYVDYDEISDWAENPLTWANAEGLIIGRTDTTIVPQGNGTRAEVATILMRYAQKFVK